MENTSIGLVWFGYAAGTIVTHRVPANPYRTCSGINLYRACCALGADGGHWWTLLLRFDYVHIWL